MPDFMQTLFYALARKDALDQQKQEQYELRRAQDLQRADQAGAQAVAAGQRMQAQTRENEGVSQEMGRAGFSPAGFDNPRFRELAELGAAQAEQQAQERTAARQQAVRLSEIEQGGITARQEAQQKFLAGENLASRDLQERLLGAKGRLSMEVESERTARALAVARIHAEAAKGVAQAKAQETKLQAGAEMARRRLSDLMRAEASNPMLSYQPEHQAQKAAAEKDYELAAELAEASTQARLLKEGTTLPEMQTQAKTFQTGIAPPAPGAAVVGPAAPPVGAPPAPTGGDPIEAARRRAEAAKSGMGGKQ